MIKLVNMKERSTPGTFSNQHFVSRHLSLAVAINTVIDRALANIPSGSMAYTRVNRRKAQEFEEAGNIDHEGKHSIFGQIMQHATTMSKRSSKIRMMPCSEDGNNETHVLSVLVADMSLRYCLWQRSHESNLLSSTALYLRDSACVRNALP